MKFEVLVFGDRAVAAKFERMGADAVNARPAFKQISRYLMEVTDIQFESQGRRGGGRWKKLTEHWLHQKERKGWDTRILHKRYPRSNTLRKSVTRPRAGGQILEITDNSINFGSSLPYAGRHQYGHGNTPARPFLKVTKGDSEKIRNMLRDHMMQAWTEKRPRSPR